MDDIDLDAVEPGRKATWIPVKGGDYVAIGHGRLGHVIRVVDNRDGDGGGWGATVDGEWIVGHPYLKDAKRIALAEADRRVKAKRQSS